MSGYLRAVGIGVLVLAAMIGVAFAITDSVPAVDVENRAAVARAVDVLAPALSGQDCPDMSRPASAEAVSAARDLARRAVRTPNRTVPDPTGTGIDTPMSEVPGVVADEVESCLLAATSPGRGWQSVLTILRTTP